MRKDEIAIRVRRLLNGGKDPRDLDAIFNWMRFNSFGLKAVAEIGNFIAHGDHKSKGLTYSYMERFAIVSDFHLLPIYTNSPGVFTVERISRVSVATFDSVPPEEIKKWFRISQKSARKLLLSAISKIAEVSEDRIVGSFTDKEWELLRWACGTLTTFAPFTDKILIQQLAEACVRNCLIDNNSVASVLNIKNVVSLYCVEKMHLGVVLLENGSGVNLRARIGDRDFLEVVMEFEVHGGHGPSIVSFPIFSTEIDASKVCSSGLLADPAAWRNPIELTPQGKLQSL